MKKIFTLLGFISSFSLSAQIGYKASYEYAGDNAKDSVLLSLYKRDLLYSSHSGHANFNVVFNDSLAYTFIGGGRKNKNNVYGKKAKHHDVFHIRDSSKNISYVRHPHIKAWLVEGIELNKNFFLMQDNVVSGKYNCMRGYFLDRNDTVFALISKDIKQPFGPYGFVGLPGLVIEIFYRKHGIYYTLTKFKEEEFSIEIPKLRTTNWIEYKKKYQ